MAYHHAFLLNGTLLGIIEIIFFSICAIIAFVICLERYFYARLTWPETILWGASAIALIWPGSYIRYGALIVFAALIAYQVFMKKKKSPPQEGAVA